MPGYYAQVTEILSLMPDQPSLFSLSVGHYGHLMDFLQLPECYSTDGSLK